MTDNDDRDRSHPLLQRKLKIYDDFFSATLLLKKALESDDLVVVEECIDRRSYLIRDIDALDQRLGKSRRFPLAVDNEKTITKLTTDIEGRLKAIGEINNDCLTLAASRRGTMAGQLTPIKQKREGLEGYALQTSRRAKFLNFQT